MANIRIKDQTTDTALVAGDYVIVDNATEGTRKFDLGQKLVDIDDDFTDVKQDLAALEGGGLSDDAKIALLACFRHIAFIDDDDDYYQDLYDALYPPTPPATLTSITCVYTQSGTVYTTDTLDSLKSDLVVTAHYDDSTTAPVTAYTLSGTLTVGTSTITVTYGEKTTTFTVTVSEAPALPLYNWDFTTGSLTDTIQGITASIRSDGNTIDSEGVHFTANASYILFGDLLTDDEMTVEVDLGTMERQGNNHGRLIMLSSPNAADVTNDGQGLIYRSTGAWSTYFAGSWGSATSYTNANAFANQTITVKKTATTIGFYLGDTLIQERTVSAGSYLLIGASPNAFYNMIVKAVRIYEGV